MLSDPHITELSLRVFAVFLRVVMVTAFLPVLSEDFLPRTVRALFALAVTACLLPVVPVHVEAMPDTTLGLAAAAVPEFLLGVLIGLTARLIFAAVQFAGQIAGEQIGFGIANVIDPTNSAQISITAQAYYLFTLLLFLAIDGHHIFFAALAKSFEMIEPFSIHLSGGLLEFINDQMTTMFEVAVMIAAPILAAMLLSNLALGLISKAVPQVNIFIESFPIRITLGLFIMALTFGALGVVLADHFAYMERELGRLLQLLQ